MKKALLLTIATLLLCNIGEAQSINLVKDINPGGGSSSPEIMGVLSNGKILFRADDGTNGTELWISDGSESGTQMLKNIRSGSNSGMSNSTYDFTWFVNDKLFFSSDDGTNGRELWISDGTLAGTKMVKDVYTGSTGGIQSVHNFAYLNGELYFNARTVGNGFELWKSDGTEGGTQLVKDIRPGSGAGWPLQMMVALGKVFFTADNGTNGRELWSSDGTVSGTNMIGDLFSGSTSGSIGNLTEFNGKLYFSGRQTNAIGTELYSTNGTTIDLVKNINSVNNASSDPTRFMVVGNKLYFAATTPSDAEELWMTDGTDAGTQLVKDIKSGASSSTPIIMGEDKNGNLILVADGGNGRELWTSDGTTTNTKEILDINGGNSDGVRYINSERDLAGRRNTAVNYMHDGKYYFAGDDGTNGTELWETDGTAAGTKMVKQVGLKPNNTASSGLDYIFIEGRNVWLSMSNGENGNELYTYVIPAPPAGIENKVKSEMTVYPNPNSGAFLIKLGANSFNNGYLKVTDISGRVVYDQGIATGSKHIGVRLNNQPAGVYVVTVNLDNRISSETITIE